MVRLQAVTIIALSVSLDTVPARALETSDTMAAWKAASAVEKGVVVDKVLQGHGAPGVVKCVDAASAAPGHADIPILQMIKACNRAGSDPV